jgi:predicted transcriptional regulator
MTAEKVMITDPVTAHQDELVEAVMLRMRQARLRMLPVVDSAGVLAGEISTFALMQHIVPDYILSGDLNQVAYAPDMGILHRRYKANASKKVSEVMDVNPLLVKKNESLLSVTAAMITFGRHEYALVVDERKRLLGVISAGDVLDRLNVAASDGENDA